MTGRRRYQAGESQAAGAMQKRRKGDGDDGCGPTLPGDATGRGKRRLGPGEKRQGTKVRRDTYQLCHKSMMLVEVSDKAQDDRANAGCQPLSSILLLGNEKIDSAGRTDRLVRIGRAGVARRELRASLGICWEETCARGNTFWGEISKVGWRGGQGIKGDRRAMAGLR